MLANASDASRLSSQEALPVSFTGTHLNIDFFSYATDLASSKSSSYIPVKAYVNRHVKDELDKAKHHLPISAAHSTQACPFSRHPSSLSARGQEQSHKSSNSSNPAAFAPSGCYTRTRLQTQETEHVSHVFSQAQTYFLIPDLDAHKTKRYIPPESK